MLAPFLFSLEMAAKKVRLNFPSMKARRRDQLVNFQVRKFIEQDKCMTRKNGDVTKTE